MKKEKTSLLTKLRSSMSMNVIGWLSIMLIFFGLVVCIIGNKCFTDAFKNEYATVTYHMADSATTFVNGDHLENYLEGRDKGEYLISDQQLDACCEKLNVSLIYVIMVDQSDYGRFVSVFNSVNNSVDNTDYTPWEIGYQRDTTNDEYREKYRAIYEQRSKYETLFRLNTMDGQHPHITTLVPVKDSSGDVAGILCVQRPINEMVEAFRPYFIMIIAGVFLMVFIIGCMTALFIRLAIIQPIKQASNEAMRFAKENTKGEPLGEISRYEVILNLARSIDSMESEMVEYIENLTAFTAEKERIGVEMNIASKIQEAALPDEFPAFPDRHEFDIYASMTPAKGVGGDFYNFILIDDDHLALIIADVSGKGVPAALFMMITNALISNRARMGGTPAEILSFVNHSIFERNKTDMFVTVWLGIVEISTGRVIAANAGHDDPAVYRKNGMFDLLRERHGFVLGGMDGAPYKDYEFRMNPGDKLFLYTDGIPEATRDNEDMFGMERMLKELNRHKDESVQQIIESVRHSVDAFVGDAPQFDDLTMLCFELKDEPSPDQKDST